MRPRFLLPLASVALSGLLTACPREAEKPTNENPLLTLAAVKAIPCVAHILNEPAPRGTRHYAFLNLAVTARHLGLPRDGAESLLRRALSLCGLPDTDPAMASLHEVYDGRYNLLNIACPSPHVKSFCNPNGCSLATRFVFS